MGTLLDFSALYLWHTRFLIRGFSKMIVPFSNFLVIDWKTFVKNFCVIFGDEYFVGVIFILNPPILTQIIDKIFLLNYLALIFQENYHTVRSGYGLAIWVSKLLSAETILGFRQKCVFFSKSEILSRKN